jgi:hypothetical protein
VGKGALRAVPTNIQESQRQSELVGTLRFAHPTAAEATFNQSMKLKDRSARRIFPEFVEPNSAHIRGAFFPLEEQRAQILRR